MRRSMWGAVCDRIRSSRILLSIVRIAIPSSSFASLTTASLCSLPEIRAPIKRPPLSPSLSRFSPASLYQRTFNAAACEPNAQPTIQKSRKSTISTFIINQSSLSNHLIPATFTIVIVDVFGRNVIRQDVTDFAYEQLRCQLTGRCCRHPCADESRLELLL